jgi:hypothetical protein
LLRNSHLAVIECRSAGSLGAENLAKQKMFLKALSEGEYINAAEIYFLLFLQLPRVDLTLVKEKLLRIWRVWETRVYIKEMAFSEKSFTYLTGQANQIFNDSLFSPLWSFSKLIRTWAHLDNALSFLSPTLNYVKEMNEYFHEEEKRNTADKLSRFPERLASAAIAVNQMPERVSSYMMFQEIMMRRKAQMISGSASKLDAVIAAGFKFFSFLVLLASVFMFFVLLEHYQWSGARLLLGPQLSWLSSQIPKFNPGIWLALFAGLAALILLLKKQIRLFKSKEHGENDDTELF